MAPIARITSLRNLDLSRNPIADFRPPAPLAWLEYLHLEDTGIDDLDPLHGLNQLTHLAIEGVPAAESDSQIAALRKALQELQIDR